MASLWLVVASLHWTASFCLCSFRSVSSALFRLLLIASLGPEMRVGEWNRFFSQPAWSGRSASVAACARAASSACLGKDLFSKSKRRHVFLCLQLCRGESCRRFVGFSWLNFDSTSMLTPLNQISVERLGQIAKPSAVDAPDQHCLDEVKCAVVDVKAELPSSNPRVATPGSFEVLKQYIQVEPARFCVWLFILEFILCLIQRPGQYGEDEKGLQFISLNRNDLSVDQIKMLVSEVRARDRFLFIDVQSDEFMVARSGSSRPLYLLCPAIDGYCAEI